VIPREDTLRDWNLVEVEIGSVRELLAVGQLGELMACQPGPGPNLVLIAPDARAALDASGLRYRVVAQDMLSVAREERRLNDEARAQRDATFFTAYRTLDEFTAHLSMLDVYPGLPDEQVTLFSIGNSIEGRPILGLRIASPNPPQDVQRPVFLITANQHAREWVAGASGMYVADRLVTGYGVDPAITALVDGVEFYVIPIVNPDGYYHTWINSSTRYWRKNRRNNGTSFGVDLNRNWAFAWGGPGSSGSPTSDTYRGTAAFSEPETAQIRDLILGVPSVSSPLPNLKAHVDLHTFSQLVLSPWGYTTSASPRASELAGLTSSMVAAVEAKHGSNYTGGPAGATLYIASGVAPDWSFGTVGALSWTFELRPQSGASVSGFSPAPSTILLSAEEAFEGIRVLAEHVQVRMRIGTVSPAPDSLASGLPADWSIAIAPENGYALDAGSEALFYRLNGGEWSQAPLTGGPSQFIATIPAQFCSSSVDFFVEARASDGFVTRLPANAPIEFFSAATPPCPFCLGDADGDQAVEFRDIISTLSNWGSVGEPGIAGDSNHDGIVGFEDILAALQNWGALCSR